MMNDGGKGNGAGKEFVRAVAELPYVRRYEFHGPARNQAPFENHDRTAIYDGFKFAQAIKSVP